MWLRIPTLPGQAHVIWIEAGDVTNDTHEVRIGMNLGYLQTNWSPSYKSFRIGWELNAGSDIGFDDVALSYSRIGCE